MRDKIYIVIKKKIDISKVNKDFLSLFPIKKKIRLLKYKSLNFYNKNDNSY